MMTWIRARLTYANVAATLALALVLGGGTAYAAGLTAGSVGTKHLKAGAVTKAKLRADAVRSPHLKDGSVTAADLAPGVAGWGTAVTRTATFTFAASNGATGEILSGTAVCLQGEELVSGGYSLSNRVSVGSQPNVIVTNSRPSDAVGGPAAVGAAADGWYVEARRNSDTVSTTVTVWALCAS